MAEPPSARHPAEHWDQLFESRRPDQMSWSQLLPSISLQLLRRVPGSVVDIGAGTSTLADALLDEGRDDVTLVDVSGEALRRSRARLGARASQVELVTSDVLSWRPRRQYDAWHDRATFHFLTDPAGQRTYVELATRAVRPGGAVVLGTFAEDGPRQCSGLTTNRYSAEQLAKMFGDGFALEHAQRETHVTPDGVEQTFTWVVLRRL